MIYRTFRAIGMALLLLYGFVSPSSAQNAQTKITLHPIYRAVPPPGDSFPQDAGHILVVSFVLLAISLAFVAVSFTESKRWNSTVPAALTVGASTCVLAEAINCYLSNVYWTTSHDSKQLMFTLLGREFDLYVGIIWWSFGSALSCCIYAALMRNVSTGTLWACLAVAGLADLVLEEVMLNYGGVYTYYGHQPLVIFGLFPCWWLFANVAGIFMGISVTYRYRNWFNGWKSIFLIPILPFCYVGPQVLAALPTIYVVQADHSPLVTQVCGILTASISVIEAGVIMDTILGRDPLHFGRTAPKGKSA